LRYNNELFSDKKIEISKKRLKIGNILRNSISIKSPDSIKPLRKSQRMLKNPSPSPIPFYTQEHSPELQNFSTHSGLLKVRI